MQKSDLKITIGMNVDVEHPKHGWITGNVKSINETTGFASVVLPGSTRGSSYKVHDLYPAGSKAPATAGASAARTFADVKVGDTIWYDDQAESKLMLECKVLAVTAEGCDTECLQINWEAEKNAVHLTRPVQRSVFTEVSVCRDNKPEAVEAPAPVVTPTVVTPTPAPAPAKPVEAPAHTQVIPAGQKVENEVALPTAPGAWYSGYGVNPAALVERPKLILAQQCKQHEALGLKKGDIGLNSIVLSPAIYTGPNSSPKVGDRSRDVVNFIVLWTRFGQYENFTDEYAKANPDAYPRRGWTERGIRAIAADTQFEMLPFADLYVLVEKPDTITDDGSNFPLDIGGRKYASALFTVRKGGLIRVMAAVSTIFDNHHGKGHFYRFGVRTVLKDGKSVFATPEMSRLGFVGEDARPALQKLHSGLAASMRAAETVGDEAETE